MTDCKIAYSQIVQKKRINWRGLKLTKGRLTTNSQSNVHKLSKKRWKEQIIHKKP